VARDVRSLALLGALAAAAAWALSRPRVGNSAAGSTNLFTAGVDAVTAAIAGWKNAGQGPKWVPLLADAEQRYGIPTDLLARIAYQESHFRQEIIDGTKDSTAGALGLMQLEPLYFTSVKVPRPFTDADTQAQIEQAAHAVVDDFMQLGDWQLTVAAYDAGLGSVRKYGGVPPFKETRDYVAAVTADVPEIASPA
jgi:soluble lytic murein transglycosylase-like protein